MVPFVMDSIDDYQMVSWTTENGLPQNSVNDIIQTDEGYIWLATYGGLVRFDGLTFKTYHIGNTVGLKSNRLKTLLESNTGGLWIGHENGGVSIFKNGAFSTPPALDSLNDEFVEDFCDDKEGNVWIGTGKGLYKFDGNSIGKLDDTNGLPNNDVVKLYYNPEGGVYVTTGGHGFSNPSLSYVNNNQVKVLSRYPISTYFNILDFNSRGELWLAYRNRIEIYVMGKLSKTIRYTNVKGSRIESFFIDSIGNIWLGSGRGLMMIPIEELSEGAEIKVSVRTFEIPELEKNVRRIMQDQEGNIWVGSDGGGLTMLKKRRVKRYFPPLNSGIQSYDEMASDGQGGLWFASLCDGLSHYKNGKFSKYKDISQCINALANDPENEKIVYVGNNTRFGKIHNYQYTFITDLAHIKPNEDKYYWQISSILKDRDDTYWLGTKGSGVIVYQGEVRHHYTNNKELPGGWVHTTIKTSKDEIWVGTDGGITIFKNDEFRQFTEKDGLVSGEIRSIYEDNDGVVWVGSYGGGLSRISGDTIVNYTIENGLSENVISRIKEDSNGNLWMLGNLGLSMIRKKQFYDLDNGIIAQLASLPFGAEEGMEEGNGAGGVVKTSDGLTWWATIKGIAGTNINLDYLDPNPPRVIIQHIKASDQVLNASNNEISLSKSQRDIEVTYAGLKFSSPEKILYRYMLEGYDNEWRTNGNRRTIIYTNLDPGSYDLKIQASNLNGAWGDANIEVLKINVLPMLHQRVWFQVFMVILLLFLIWIIFGMRERYLVKKRLALADIIRSRTEELNIKNKKLESQKMELEEALNSLQETQRRLVQSEKMASLGVLSAGVAHEINNPLQFIQNGIDIIQQSKEDLEALRKKLPVSLEIIENGINRASAIVSSLTQFSRINDRFDEQFNISSVLDNCLIMLGSNIKDGVEIVKNYPDHSPVCKGNQGKLHQAFLNILLNAEQAIENEGSIEVKVENGDKKTLVTISDTGVGIPSENKTLLFDPFYTTKPPGEGTGLGLSITYDIIAQHHGTISVQSDGKGHGTAFTVTLPAQ